MRAGAGQLEAWRRGKFMGKFVFSKWGGTVASVVVASHNLEKCRQAAQNITQEVGGAVVGMLLDLSSFQSIRNFTVQFLKDPSHLLKSVEGKKRSINTKILQTVKTI